MGMMRVYCRLQRDDNASWWTGLPGFALAMQPAFMRKAERPEQRPLALAARVQYLVQRAADLRQVGQAAQGDSVSKAGLVIRVSFSAVGRIAVGQDLALPAAFTQTVQTSCICRAPASTGQRGTGDRFSVS